MYFGESLSADEAIRVADEAIFAKTGKHLNDVQRTILLGSLEGDTYHDIADKHPYSPDYLKQDAGPTFWKMLSMALGETVSKRNFRYALERRWRSQPQPQTAALNFPPSRPAPISVPAANDEWGTFGPNRNPRTSWGTRWLTAPETALFFGRETELDRLEDWITSGCRLLMVFGLPGVGKTQLALKLARQVQEQFDIVIWRSLKNWEFQNRPPTLAELLENLILTISDHPPHTFDLAQLLDYLIQYRCLIVLDGLDVMLRHRHTPGLSEDEYEAYCGFLAQVGSMATIQQSCLILTSQEHIQAIEAMEYEMPARVRSEQLKGLGELSGRNFVNSKGRFLGSDRDWNLLIHQCGGNPALLSSTAHRIQTLFGGDVTQFLNTSNPGTDHFGDVHGLLSQLFERLSVPELAIIRHLAESYQPITFEVLRTTHHSMTEQELSETLRSLGRRGLIEGNRPYFLPNLVAKFVATYLTELSL